MAGCGAVGSPTTSEVLASLRRTRGFDAHGALASKVGRISTWFGEHDLDAAVVGVSGGVDSATVLGLLQRTMEMPGSPLRQVVAAVLPIEGPGATGQAAAERRALAVTERFGAEAWVCPLGEMHRAALAALERGSASTIDGWAAGQLLSIERTPILYGAVALLRQAGRRAVVVGTTNRDEGAYLGFFGKASDGTVDVQPISDLHKSEVVALARALGVPDEVLAAAPSGDVWDGRSDREMIGADYDDIECVLRLLEYELDPVEVASTLRDGERLVAAAAAVDRLHRENAHKYAVGSPAVHLDVLPRGVPGGWADAPLAGRGEAPPDDRVGRWDPPPIELDPPVGLPVRDDRGRCVVGRVVLSAADCRRLLDALASAPVEPVGVTGVRADAGVGSMRSTAFSAELADALWRRVRPVVPSVRFLDEFDSTDGHAAPGRDGHRTWRVVGLSPLLRFMRYEAGGRHLCHYDAGYDYGDGRRTLMSAVFFLSGEPNAGAPGGALRFVDDGQGHVPVSSRRHDDWDRDTRDDEVLDAITPTAGSVVLFDHRRCHDVEAWRGPGSRVVIRADVVYERVPDGLALA